MLGERLTGCGKRERTDPLSRRGQSSDTTMIVALERERNAALKQPHTERTTIRPNGSHIGHTSIVV